MAHCNSSKGKYRRENTAREEVVDKQLLLKNKKYNKTTDILYVLFQQ